MDPFTFYMIMFLGAILAGIFGALFGLGGGVIIIPILTLGLGVKIHEAIGASIIAVIATSSAAATIYVQEHLTNIRLGIVLETATTVGAITGALIAVYVNEYVLATVFGVILIYAAFYIICKPERLVSLSVSDKACDSRKCSLLGSYVDKLTNKTVKYEVKHLKRGLGASFAAGNLSGMLGIGGGIVKVPAMNLWMNVPIKAAIATSNFMIGVTALASAYIYYTSGYLSSITTALVAVGVFLGASFGSRVAGRIESKTLRSAFAIVMILISILMFLKASGHPLTA